MQENQLYALWQALGRSQRFVRDRKHRLRVLDAGRLNLSFGPDFSGASFELDGTRFYGDVEMHLKQADWYRHRHHVNPFYRNVALHVVLSQPEEPAEVHSVVGQRFIPSFFIDERLLQSPVSHPALHCRPTPTFEAVKVLQHLALKRLNFKIRRFYQRQDVLSNEQFFYEIFLRVLGYPANAEAFLLLARHFPVHDLSRIMRTPFVGFENLYALYAGQAGFLSGHSADAYHKRLKAHFAELRSDFALEPMPLEHWRFSGVRAVNHPHFRLAAWVALLQKAKGIPIAPLYALFAQRLPYNRLLSELESYFKIPVSGYWRDHFRLGGHAVERGAAFYFGRARIFELLINAFIPYLMVRARRSQSDGFVAYLQNFYLWLPLATEYVSLSRHFPWWQTYRAEWSAHALWQALLQLDAEFCRVRACARCPLRHALDTHKEFC